MFSLSLQEREKLLTDEENQFVHFKAGTDFKYFNKNSNLMTTLFLDSLTPSQVLKIVLRGDVNHVIQNSFEPMKDKIKFIQRLDQDYLKFYQHDFLILNNPEVFELFVFSSTESKDFMIDKIFTFLKIKPNQSRHFGLVSVLTELIMNAQDISGAYREIAETKHIEILVEKSKSLIAFSVYDHAGALTFSRILKRIESTFEIGYRDSINFGRGGAGIGTSIIYNHSESIYLSCKHGETTRVSAVVPYNKNEKESILMQKSIHLIQSYVKVKTVV